MTRAPPEIAPAIADARPIGVHRLPGKGRGIIARASASHGDLLELAATVVLTEADTDALVGTTLDDYYFAHPTDPDAGLLVLGHASLCNHAADPNAETTAHLDPEVGWLIQLRALRQIDMGEEITRRYTCEPWFEVAG